jgi:hypothetical protein
MITDVLTLRRFTMPLYIREKSGWIDSVNVYLSDAVRYCYIGQMYPALCWVDQAQKLYPDASFAVQIKAWIFQWNLLDDLANQMYSLGSDLKSWKKDWYLERFYQINRGIITNPSGLFEE